MSVDPNPPTLSPPIDFYPIPSSSGSTYNSDFIILLLVIVIVVIIGLTIWYVNKNKQPKRRFDIVNYCPSCGYSFDNKSNFCGNCGKNKQQIN